MDRNTDLEPSHFPGLSWDDADLTASLQAVYDWVEGEGVRAAQWYLREKRPKSRWSRGLRAMAIVFATAGATFPFIATQSDDVGIEWGYVLLGLAAGAIALDRFFGFSTAWMRYMAAELAIHNVLQNLQFQWAATQLKRSGRRPTNDEALAQLEALARVAAAINDEVQRETLAWVEEFRSNLSDELRPVPSPAEPRALGRGGSAATASP